jgi:2-oxoglutarate dehydrogenase E1 component
MAQDTKFPGPSRPGQPSSASVLTGTNGPYLEAIQELYLQNPQILDPSFKDLFATLDLQTPAKPRGPALRSTRPSKVSSTQEGLDPLKLFQLITAYKEWGHFSAALDPLKQIPGKVQDILDVKTYGFTSQDMERDVPQIFSHYGQKTLQGLIQRLKDVYCGSLGYEFMHIQNLEARNWFENALEKPSFKLSSEGKKELLNTLTKAEVFEKFLALKFPGAKRFGLEGGESFIPLLDQILKTAVPQGLKEAVIGMAHRGRLNVLTHTIGKEPREILCQFQGNKGYPEGMQGSGDVKYHLGASKNRVILGHDIHVSLTSNPSHLEAVNPVVVGKVRAKQTRLKDGSRAKVLGILVHGDAAFAGQGIVSETLLLCDLGGYRTGGTLHIIINNQIGFTTSPHCSRSSPYSSDVAKTIQAPIIHVNGDDPEAVLWAAHLATEYRYRFKKDVVIDLYCYRRHGHNEMDEPAFTQPLMYKNIRQHPTTRDLYESRLVEEKVLNATEAKHMQAEYQAFLQKEFVNAHTYKTRKADWLEGVWSSLTSDITQLEGETGVSDSILQTIGQALTTIPKGFSLHPKLERFLNQRKDIFQRDMGCDWATGEALAFGSLLLEGYPVRLSGQDCGRGTFSQRHGVFVDQETGIPYVPLNGIEGQRNELEIIDSPLAEASVLGFELGYSLADPYSLVLWEAQFGDFSNGAQIIMDQFISSGETKWLRLSSLVLLLPHGYEGQGPEHSSARLERYLQLCAEDNMIVANCTTPANYFHILRRQIVHSVRKPLILMTPKSLLRDKHATSSLKDMGPRTSFQKVLNDPKAPSLKAKQITRVILCSGKIAYELMHKRDQESLENCVILRLEQLHPFPYVELKKVIQSYSQAEVIWCQEEPKNMGSWFYTHAILQDLLKDLKIPYSRLSYAGRSASAATATGYYDIHKQEQEKLIQDALGLAHNT